MIVNNVQSLFYVCILLLVVPSGNGVSITGVTAAVTSSVIVILAGGVLVPVGVPAPGDSIDGDSTVGK